MRVAHPRASRRTVARGLVAPVLVVALAFGVVLPAPAPVAAASTWTMNLFAPKAFLYQDPYWTACTAASAMHMLNTVAYRRSGGTDFRWTPTRIKADPDSRNYRDMTSILSFERRYDTIRSTSPGSDAHGWRNALNYYGWGREVMTDSSRRPYEDRAFGSYASAMKAAVRAIARFRMPVGVLAWAGAHAQVITGYVVTGEDPASSSDFTIQYVFLSDPLRSASIVNRKVAYGSMRDGSLRWRFQWYRETDSPFDDPYTGGWIRSSVAPKAGRSEWFHRWVLLLPVRAAPSSTPDPTPTPTPTPTPDPASPSPDTASPSPTAATAVASPSPDATSAPTASTTPAPMPTPSPSVAATPTPSPFVAATPTPSTAPSAEPAASPSAEPSPPAP